MPFISWVIYTKGILITFYLLQPVPLTKQLRQIEQCTKIHRHCKIARYNWCLCEYKLWTNIVIFTIFLFFPIQHSSKTFWNTAMRRQASRCKKYLSLMSLLLLVFSLLCRNYLFWSHFYINNPLLPCSPSKHTPYRKSDYM